MSLPPAIEPKLRATALLRSCLARAAVAAALWIASRLYARPLYEIGYSAVTDHVYLWGIDGLSMADAKLHPTDVLQSILCMLALSCAVIALVRVRLAWVAAALSAAAFALACISARIVASEPRDLLRLEDGWWLSALAILALGVAPFLAEGGRALRRTAPSEHQADASRS